MLPIMSMPSASAEARAFTHTRLFEALARAGYAARGIIYLIIGILALRLARGVGTEQASQQGALRTLAHQTFGHALLLAMAIGLGGYALWRAAQALVGETPEAGRHSAMDRLAAVGSGIAYGAFCAIAISVLRGRSGGNSSSTSRKATSDALGWPAGRELVGLVGLVIIGIGVYQMYQGVAKRFLEDSKTGQMSPEVLRAFTALGVAGHVARGIAFGLIGVFAIKAAIQYKPREAVGLDGALYRLTQHTYGSIALLIVALGLIAFGVYSLADARFRKI